MSERSGKLLEGIDDGFAAAVLSWFEPEVVAEPDDPDRLCGEFERPDDEFRRTKGGGSRWLLALVLLVVIAMAGVALSLGGGDDGATTKVKTGPPSTAVSTTVATIAATTTTAVASTTVDNGVTTTAATLDPAALNPAALNLTTTVPPPALPAQIVASGMLGFGSSATALSVDLANPGGSALGWSARSTLAGSSVSPASGVLAPGAHVPIKVALNRAAAPEGSLSGQLTVTGNGLTAQLPMSAQVNRAPVIWSAGESPATIYLREQCGPTQSVLSAVVTDGSLASVVAVYDTGTGVSARASMSPIGGSTYNALIGPFQTRQPADLTWFAEATDTNGVVTRSAVATVTFGRCAG